MNDTSDQPSPPPGQPTETGEQPDGPGPNSAGPGSPGPNSAGHNSAGNAPQFNDLGSLRRVVGPERKVGGVAGGLARHYNLDPVILRVLFAALTLFGGTGPLLYLAGWLLIPEEGSNAKPFGLDGRSRTLALYGAVGIGAIIAVSAGDLRFGGVLVVICVGMALVYLAQSNRSRSPHPPSAPGPSPASPTLYSTDSMNYSDSYSTGYSPGYSTPPPPRRGSEYKRGPLLFPIALAVAAIALGTLGVIHVAGTAVPFAAYPALALVVVGVFLVIGAFWGRAGGLILSGLLILPMLLVASAGDQWDGERNVRFAPTSASDVEARYAIQDGRINLDLTELRDPENLDGLLIDVEARAGAITVTVPDDLRVEARGKVRGAGELNIFDSGSQGGLSISDARTNFTTNHQPDVVIDADLFVGDITVQEGSSR